MFHIYIYVYHPINSFSGAKDCSACPSGFICSGGKILPCETGHYCQGGRSLRCPPGTFSPLTTNQVMEDCTQCMPSSFCVGGQAAVSGACEVGHFCRSGVNVPNPGSGKPFVGQGGLCPVGHKCGNGTGDPIPCEPGQYQNEVRALTENADEIRVYRNSLGLKLTTLSL